MPTIKTRMRKLIAQNRHHYGTRRLQAGDEYEATEMHARLLVAARRALYAPDKPPPPAAAAKSAPQPAAKPAPPPQNDDDLDRLRGEAQRFGIEIDGRWGTVRLEHEIAQAKSK